MAFLTLDDIIDISVSLLPSVSYRRTLNSALFMTNATTTFPVSDRIKEIEELEDVIDLGFATTSCEYKTIELYFAQNPAPPKCYLGVKGSSETLLQAVTACRGENYEWYVCIPVQTSLDLLSSSEVTGLASYIQSVSPESLLALNFTSDSTNFDASVTALKAGKYSKTIVMYDNVEANENKTSVAGIIGYALGANKTLSSSFTLAYKSITGLTSATFTRQVLKGHLDNYVNVYVNQGAYYDLFRQGTMMSGDRFDEIYYIDMLVNDLKSALMNLLVTHPKIPQTQNGVDMLSTAISETLDTYVDLQFIASGKWLGGTVLNLNYGDILTDGYLIQFESLDNQSAADRVARKAPKCYICCKLAGAIEYITIGISVSR